MPIAIITIVGMASGQVGYNIDLDCQYCPPPLGGGSPSDSFGGENDIQRGFWNKLPASGHGPIQLRDLAGNLTSVTATGEGSGVGGGDRFEANTDQDIAALQNDGHDVLEDATWVFDGLVRGRYLVVTYASHPSDKYNPTPVTVDGVTKYVTGPMPANKFIEGVSHSVHETWSDGRLAVLVQRGEFDNGFINGFQLVPIVPEPAGMVAVMIAFTALALNRRRRRRVG